MAPRRMMMDEILKRNVIELAEDRRAEGYTVTADAMLLLVAEVERLTAERDALAGQLAKVRNGGGLDPVQTKAAEQVQWDRLQTSYLSIPELSDHDDA
jgi:hypothetical protein